MKEKWQNFKESLTDITSMSKREFLLTMAVCLLGGIVFGLLFSPRKSMMIASNNGNNNGNDNGNNNSDNLSGRDIEEKDEIEDWDHIEEREEQK